MLSLLQYHKKMLLQADSEDENEDSQAESNEVSSSSLSNQGGKGSDVLKVKLRLRPSDEQTFARLKLRSNNNFNPEVCVATDINHKLTDLMVYLAESEFKEDVSSIVLSIGGSENQEIFATGSSLTNKRNQRKKGQEK